MALMQQRIITLVWLLSLSSCSTTPPTFDKARLPSGLTVVSQQMAESKIVAVQVNVRGGLSAEPEGKEGLAYLTANLLFRGTTHRTNTEIITELEYLSAKVNVMVNPDFTAIRLVCLDKNFVAAWAIVAECLSEPLLDSVYFELQKVGLQNEIAASQDNMTSVAEAMLWNTMYPGHGYGHPSGGRIESLPTLTLEDVHRHYRELYTAPNTIITLVAGDERPAIQDTLIRRLSHYPSAGVAWNSPPPVSRVPASARVEREKLQTVILYGYAMNDMAADAFPIAALATQVLGGGTGSRLWQLRQRDKLAYAVSARYDQFQRGGAIRVILGTTASNRDKARDSMESVIRQFEQGGVSVDELSAAKSILVADAMRSAETSSGRVARMSYFEITGLGAGYGEHFGQTLENITVEQVNSRLPGIFGLSRRVDVMAGPLR